MKIEKKEAVFIGIGFELVGLVIGSIIISSLLEEHFGWPGDILILVFLMTSMGSWLAHVLFLVKKFDAEKKIQSEKSSNDKGPLH